MLLGWGRSRGVTVDVIERLWRLYVERACLFGLGVPILSHSAQHSLGSLQGKTGRSLLGFSAASPAEALTLELGWLPWAMAAGKEQLSLLRRLSSSNNSLVQAIS